MTQVEAQVRRRRHRHLSKQLTFKVTFYLPQNLEEPFRKVANRSGLGMAAFARQAVLEKMSRRRVDSSVLDVTGKVLDCDAEEGISSHETTEK